MLQSLGRHFRASSFFLAGILCGSAITGTAFAYQTHMWNAQNHLKAAYHQLSLAVPDKAGHRVNAMQLVNQAEGQVSAGIAAGAK